MTAPAKAAAAPKAARASWLINPPVDLALFVAVPLLAWPLIRGLQHLFSFDALKLAILSVSATGHHLPGFIRAYTDPRIFAAFKSRLLLVPALFVLLAVAAASLKLTVMFLILIVWSAWHGGMQILGFLRIYDLKAGFKSALTARLDFWICVAWFVQVVLWAPGKKTSVLSSFYLSGGPLLPVEPARLFQQAWLAFTLAITAVYAARVFLDWRRHGYFNPAKLLCMAFSFGFWGYCLIAVDNLILGLLLWEVFHDLQYNAFVWHYNRSRVQKGLSRSPAETFLFGAGWKRLSVYAAAIVAYGSLGLLSQDLLNVYDHKPAHASWLFQFGNVFAASALIHFYLDGFIWKVRDAQVQRDLGVGAPETYARARSGGHWAFVALFFAGATALAASEYFHWNASQRPRHLENLLALVPESGYANFLMAGRLQGEGKADSAVYYFEQAMRRDTSYRFAHALVADLKVQGGDWEGALTHYEEAARLDPGDAAIGENLAALYQRSGRHAQAAEVFRLLATRDSLNAGHAFQAAWALLQMKRGLDAKPFLERTLRLDPAQPKAWNYLGMVEQALGNRDAARAAYRKALELDSAYAHARENLAGLEIP